MNERNQYLTKTMEFILRWMRDNEGTDEGELVQATPGGWWLGDGQVDPRACYQLLRLCLIRRETFCTDDHIIYSLNSEAKAILDDIKFVPPIIQELENRNAKPQNHGTGSPLEITEGP